MGIPRFYRWLKGRYPMIRFDLTDSNKEIPIFDNFYIDFNALVYQCIRESGCFLKNKVQPLTFQQIAERVLQYLLELVRVVNPRKLLFIAFDGVAPRAKINQSRDRRFRSGIEDIDFFDNLVKKVGIKTEEYFQANSISPGTEFLFKLCETLKKQIMQLMSTEWKGLHVFYSDCCVPGEGEHKIMDFLRYSKQIELFNKNTTHCVYSPDADVILLTLTLNLDYICIIKEDTTQLPSMSWTATSTFRKTAPPQFQLVMINILRQYFEKQFQGVLSQVKNCTIQQIINDLVLLMAFVGNDFLPVEFCFVLKDNHMDALFAQYKKYLLEHQQFINIDGDIDWKNVSRLLKLARKFQANMISEMKNQKRAKQSQQEHDPSIFSDKEEEEKNSEIQKFEVEDEKIVNGIDNYYRSRFNIQDRRNDGKFEEIIKAYIEGLSFYCQYYYKGLQSWTWFYPFHYTPLLCDVDDYITSHAINVQLKKDEPFDPILALMFMLPEQNFGLLPTVVARELTDPKCILKSPKDYFPKQFQYDKFETLKYNKRALIYFLPDSQTKKVYESIKPKLSQLQLQRNIRKNTIFFYEKEDSYVGVEVTYNEKFKNQLQKIIRVKYDGKQKESNQRRFPALSLYGAKCKLNEKGKMVPEYKYKYQGNPSEIVFFNNFVGYVDKMEKCTPDIRESIESEYDKQGIAGTCDNYYIVKRGQFVREVERFNVALTKRQVVVPDYALFKAPNLDYIHKIQKYQWKDLYKLKERVVILTSKYFGCTGVIEQLGQKEVKVRLSGDPIKSQSKIEEIQQDFYTLSYVLDRLQISTETFFAIIGEVIILPKPGSKKNFNDRLPTALNFGLNFIDINNCKIVPQYVRCNFKYENTKNPQQIFNGIEVSETGLKMLQRYISQFHWLVETLQDCKSGKTRKEFRAVALFPKEKDPNIKVYQEFIKLYDLHNKGSFYSIYSRVAQQNFPKFYTEKKGSNAIVSFAYYEIISKNQALIAPPAYRLEPQYHDIGARVILLRTLQVGYVVGIDDHWIHVLLGKSQRKARVKFTDIYNEAWQNFLSKDMGKCWNLEVSYYSPTFYKEAIVNKK